MANFAATELAAGSGTPHEFVELSAMRVFMAGCARQVAPVIQRRRRLEFCRQLVAIVAGDRLVSSGQRKSRLLVTGQAEGGGLEPLQIVALLAAIQVGRRSELRGVGIFVAICAVLELEPVERIFAPRDVALPAS